MTKEREFIEAMYRRRAKNDDNGRNLANIINSSINNNLSGDKYLNELIQNADDAESSRIDWVEVDGYLIFKHQGKHFLQEDVEGIVNCADPHRKKTEDLTKIGNKGIGFKSVFSMASQVSILSKEYTFQFDEQHELWKDDPKTYPWQTIPIWLDKTTFPDSVKKHLDETSVCFVFKIRKNILTDIKTHLGNLTTRYLLFLRHVKEIKIGSEKTVKLSERKKFSEGKINKIVINDTFHWYLWERKYNISEELKALILADANIAPKYKKGEPIPISIAIRSKDGKLVPLTSAPRVFCYLPTNIELGLKFIVHAEFLLDDSRMGLRDDKIGRAWNGFILANIFSAQIEFLSELNSSSEFWRYLFNVISSPALVPDIFKEACKGAFSSAIEKFLLGTNMEVKSVLVKNLYFDRFNFVKNFGDVTLKSKCVHEDTENKAALNELGRKYLPLDDIKSFLIAPNRFPLNIIKNLEKNKLFLSFVRAISKDEEPKKWFKDYFASGCILSSNGQLKKPEEIYTTNEALEEFSAQFSFLSMVHPEIVQLLGRDWLREMGVNELNLEHMIDEANKEKSQIIPFTIKLSQQKKLEDLFEDKAQEKNRSTAEKEKIRKEKLSTALKKLKVKMANGTLVEASHSYLPNALNPTTPIEPFVGDASPYVFAGYPLDDDITDVFRNFLLTMGMQQTVDLKTMTAVTEAVNNQNDPQKIIAYTQFIFKNHFIPVDDKQRKKILIQIASLKVVTAQGNSIQSSLCYLADQYLPEQSLGDVILPTERLSVDYYENEHDIPIWRDFFTGLGVVDTLSIDTYASSSPANLRTCDDKFNVYARDVGLEDLWSTRTQLSGYAKIHFVLSIYTTMHFWELLLNNWDEIKPVINRTTYKGKAVASNIHYWVNKSIKHTYGDDKSSSDYYYHVLSDKLKKYAAALPIANQTQGMNETQASMLGFRTHLSQADAVMLLNKIAQENHCAEDFEQICFIYKELLRSESIDDPVDVLLANQKNEFSKGNALYYIENNLFSHLENTRLIKKPNTISEVNFKKLIQKFGVKLIAFSDLNMGLATQKSSPLFKKIQERLVYILHAEAKQKDWMGDKDAANQQALSEKIQQKIQALKCICADSIRIHFQDVFSEVVDVWIDPEKQMVHHQEELDLEAQQKFYIFIHKHLELCCSLLDFIAIMTSSVDKLNRKFNLLPAPVQDNTASSASSSVASKKRENESDEEEDHSVNVKKLKQTRKSGVFFLDEETRRKMGRLGEEAVYNALRKKHMEKYKDKITDHETGYTIQRPNDQKTITWMNKIQESRAPYDFTITYTKDDKIIERRDREVKTFMEKDGQVQKFYPMTEWNHMQKTLHYRFHLLKAEMNDEDEVQIVDNQDILAKIDIKQDMIDKNIVVEEYRKLIFTNK